MPTFATFCFVLFVFFSRKAMFLHNCSKVSVRNNRRVLMSNKCTRSVTCCGESFSREPLFRKLFKGCQMKISQLKQVLTFGVAPSHAAGKDEKELKKQSSPHRGCSVQLRCADGGAAGTRGCWDAAAAVAVSTAAAAAAFFWPSFLAR